MKGLSAALALMFALIMPAAEASTGAGKIVRILAGPNSGLNGAVFIKLNASISQSGCATNPDYQYVLDASTEQGKVTLSVLLAAYTAGKAVSVAGTGDCTLFHNVENLAWLQIDD